MQETQLSLYLIMLVDKTSCNKGKKPFLSFLTSKMTLKWEVAGGGWSTKLCWRGARREVPLEQFHYLA